MAKPDITISVTGPRTYNSDEFDHILIEKLMEVKAQNPDKTIALLSGGSRGFDAAAVAAAKGLNIPTFILFPNRTFPTYYWLGEKTNGERVPTIEPDPAGLKEMCTDSVVLPPVSDYVTVYRTREDGTRYEIHSNFVRNEVLIERADIVIVGAANKSDAMQTSGTAHALRLAIRQEKEIRYLSDEKHVDGPVEFTKKSEGFDPWAM